ncbi:MAG: isocitrate lyase/phosphoenolpyruvate mutase family protein [Alcaligenaceae bacterium]
MMSPRERFRQLLASEVCNLAAPIFDPLSARIAELQGWEVAKLSGSVAKFANLAIPDGIALSNISDLVDVCWRIQRVANLCLIADADDGGHNAIAVARTIRELEATGVCAIEIEDVRVPTHLASKREGAQQAPTASDTHSYPELLPLAEQVNKLKAAVAARRDPLTVIVARTRALEHLSLEQALVRISAYHHSGAEALMFPELPNGRSDIEAIRTVSNLPLFVLRMSAELAADTKYLTAQGVKIRYLGQSPYTMAVQAIYDGLANLKAGGDPLALKSRQASTQLLREVDRSAEFESWQRQYMAK